MLRFGDVPNHIPDHTKENMTTFYMGESRPNYREADQKLIDEGLKSKDPNDRRQAQIAKDRLNMENKKIRDMRDALVRAHREGNKAEIKDIHDFIKNKPEYRNGW